MKNECIKCQVWDMSAKANGYASGICGECHDERYIMIKAPEKPVLYEEYGTATGISFCTSEGIKTMEAGKLYDKDLNEI